MPTGNVYLCGFMGSGKSTLGPLLAQRLGHAWIDLDAAVEAKAGMPVSEIFEKLGEATFRRLEFEALCELKGPAVVSLGGGALLSEDTNRQVQTTGLRIYLKASVDTILDRIKEEADRRPLLRGEGNVRRRIEALLSERQDGYDASELHIVTDARSPNQLADEVVSRLSL